MSGDIKVQKPDAKPLQTTFKHSTQKRKIDENVKGTKLLVRGYDLEEEVLQNEFKEFGKKLYFYIFKFCFRVVLGHICG